jgi:hypothetical protein
MTRKYWHFGLVVLVTGAATLGCTRTAVQQKPPPDPLLMSVKVSNKPVVEAKAQSSTSEARSQMYPLPPALPGVSQVAPAVRTVPLQAYKD